MNKPTYSLGLALLVLPWVSPFTYGPTTAVAQWLLSLACAAMAGILFSTSSCNGASKIEVIRNGWLLAAGLSAIMGLLQYLGLAAEFSPWVSYVEAGQAYANLRQRNQMATLLAIGLSALLWWQVQNAANAAAVQGTGLPWRAGARLAPGLAAVLLATADAASGSRTGLLQLLVLLALGLLWKRGRATLVLVLLAYAVAAWVLPRLAGLDPLHSGILGRVGEAAAPCSSRLTLWSNVLHLIAQKPWTGWGWGELGYAHFMTLYSGQRFCEIMGNAHNLPLHLAAELGIPVAVLVCGLTLWLVLRAKPWRERDATRQMAWSVLAVIGAHSLLEYPLWYGPFQLAAVLAVWLLWQTPRDQTGHRTLAATNRPVAARAGWSIALACTLLLACSYAGWDYWRISQIYLGESQRAASYREDTLEKIRPSRLFAGQVRFAELGITPLSADNAPHLHALALELLHFSPEASVVGKVIESAERLGLAEEAAFYRQRFQAAYVLEYAGWLASHAGSGRGDKVP
jgi:O-antigen ligase